MAQLIALFNCAGGEIHKTDQTEKRREGTKQALAHVHALAFKKKGVCVWREAGREGGRRQRRRKTDRTKVEGPLGKASAVPTANSREMSITLPTSETFMRASGPNQSLHLNHLPGKYSLSE